MSQLPVLAYVFDRRKRASNNKQGSIELRVTYNRKTKWISTGIRLLPKEWRGRYAVNREDAKEINDSLDKLMVNARRVVNAMEEDGNINIDAFPQRLKDLLNPPVQKAENTFIDFCKERAEVRIYGKTPDSQKRYERFMKFFVAWGGITEFSDITEAKIIEMDKLLQEKKLMDSSKWNNYHRFLNSFIMDAIDDGIIKRNPYKHVRINHDKESRSLWKHLTVEEFKKIEKMKLPTESLRQVRDVFVFQVYTCLAYVDLLAFASSKIKTIKGRKYYTGNRGKTHQEFSFLLLKPACDILDKYDGVLPVLSNQKYNDYLKIMIQYAGLEKPISSHWARHTGATLLLNMGVDMEVVAKVLGHSSTKITRSTYAKLLDDTIIEAMQDAEKKLSKRMKPSSKALGA